MRNYFEPNNSEDTAYENCGMWLNHKPGVGGFTPSQGVGGASHSCQAGSDPGVPQGAAGSPGGDLQESFPGERPRSVDQQRSL